MNRCADVLSRLATATTCPCLLREIARQFFFAIPAVDKIPQRQVSDFKGIMFRSNSLPSVKPSASTNDFQLY
jgi:hypothetical protein